MIITKLTSATNSFYIHLFYIIYSIKIISKIERLATSGDVSSRLNFYSVDEYYCYLSYTTANTGDGILTVPDLRLSLSRLFYTI